ncbi:MAG: RsmE family RNA methyltransferase [Actinomycetota bacterium]
MREPRVNPLLRDSVAHVFVDDLTNPQLEDNDRHHLSRVLRVRDGESITVSDGKGAWRVCEWSDGDVRVAGDILCTSAPSPHVGIAFAPVKGDRNEWAVQKLTEIGVDHIVLLAPTRRSVVRWSNVEKQLEKLRVVAREAAMQSRRTWLPTVSGFVSLADALATPGAAVADPTGNALHETTPALVIIGPEGGFDADESPANAARISLGDTILRAETATLVAATLLMARRTAGK